MRSASVITPLCTFPNQIADGPSALVPNTRVGMGLCTVPHGTCVILGGARVFVQPAKQTSPCPFQPLPAERFCPSCQLGSHVTPGQWLANLFCKETNSQYFRFWGTRGISVAASQLWHHSVKVATGFIYKALSMDMEVWISHNVPMAWNIILT